MLKKMFVWVENMFVFVNNRMTTEHNYSIFFPILFFCSVFVLYLQKNLCMTTLTEAQSQVLNFIHGYIRTWNKPPTYREIADKMNYASLNSVVSVIDALCKKGYLQKGKGARGIVLSENALSLEQDDGTFSGQKHQIVNVLSFVHTKQKPLLQVSGLVSFDVSFTKNNDCFCVFSSDEGMSPSGIFNKDLLLVQKINRHDLVGGEMCAILTPDGVLARFVKIVNGRLYFVPSAKNYSELTDSDFQASQFEVLGVVLASIKRFWKQR